MSSSQGDRRPYVAPEEKVPEVTLVALLLGAVLAVVMGGANIYLALKVGMTVSASIPAAVISMGLLRGLLRRGTILENNIVQTMASTGESLAAGAVFTIPALLLIGEWQEFRFWPTTLIVLLGGLLGIVFMVPLRRALIVERTDLVYPEGVACADILAAGQQGGKAVRLLAVGLGIGAAFKFLATGLHVLHGTVEGAFARGRSVLYFGADMSVALLAVGYIVRLPIASLVFVGGTIGWLVAMPGLGSYEPGAAPLDVAWDLWSTKIRYIGVGAMIVGGLYSVWDVRKGILAGMAALGAMRHQGASGQRHAVRTDRDLPLAFLAAVFLSSTFAVFMLYDYLIGSWAVAAIAAVVMIVAVFVLVAVATYIAGLVGSSNSPVSGMTICALLMTAGVLLALGVRGESAMAATLGVAGVVCCATCTAGDVSQDLKTGLLLGATPARQQWTEMVGAVVPAFFFAPILSLLHHAYGIGTGEPDALRAPQAALFASLVKGLWGDAQLPWNMIAIGAGIGLTLIATDRLLQLTGREFRIHVMPVAVGIYLPLSLAVPIFLGGLIRHWFSPSPEGQPAGLQDSGVLFGSGLIAGESLLGILLAIPLALGLNLPRLECHWVFSIIAFGAVVAAYAFLAPGRGRRASGV